MYLIPNQAPVSPPFDCKPRQKSETRRNNLFPLQQPQENENVLDSWFFF